MEFRTPLSPIMALSLRQRNLPSLQKSGKLNNRTSSPHYPQSNGRAENAVKTCKSLLKKAKASGEDPLLALLDWRTDPD